MAGTTIMVNRAPVLSIRPATATASSHKRRDWMSIPVISSGNTSKSAPAAEEARSSEAELRSYLKELC
jgi:hypothetical protein